MDNQDKKFNNYNKQSNTEYNNYNDNQELNNIATKIIKNGVLYASYWIAIYELISIVTYFAIRFGDSFNKQVIDKMGGFSYAIFTTLFGPFYWIALLILVVPIFICFLVCFIAVMDIDKKVKNNEKITSKVAIINLIFEVLYTIIVWGTNTYTVAVGNIVLICISLIGIVSSLVLFAKIKQYNNFLLSGNIRK